MKKVFLFLAATTLFLSCTKQTNRAGIDKVLSQSNKSIQKEMYGKLTPTEKFTIWDDKFSKVLETGTLTKEQREFIEQLKSTLSVHTFEKLATGADLYKQQIIKLFGWKQGYEIFASVNSESYIDSDFSNGGGYDCMCSHSSDYCDRGSICSTGITCNSSVMGCGTLLVFACDGQCWFPN